MAYYHMTTQQLAWLDMQQSMYMVHIASKLVTNKNRLVFAYTAALQPHLQQLLSHQTDGSYLKVNSISFTPQYKSTITF